MLFIGSDPNVTHLGVANWCLANPAIFATSCQPLGGSQRTTFDLLPGRNTYFTIIFSKKRAMHELPVQAE